MAQCRKTAGTKGEGAGSGGDGPISMDEQDMVDQKRRLFARKLHAVVLGCAVSLGVMGSVRALGAMQPRDRAATPFFVDQPVIELGAIADDQPQVRVFNITNTSATAVRLKMSYCHFCTPPMLGKDLLNPNESTTLVLELDPAGKRGDVEMSATVQVAGKLDTSVTMRIKASVFPRVDLQPQELFPRVVQRHGLVTEVRVLGRQTGFKVERVESDVPGVSAELGEVVEMQDMGTVVRMHPMLVRFAAGLPLGELQAHLTVFTTDERMPKKDLFIRGEVVGDVQVDPQTVGAAAGAGQAFQTWFDLVAEDSLGVEVEELDFESRAEAPALTLDVRRGPDPTRVRVVVTGIAPLRERVAAEIPVLIKARARGAKESESLRALIILRVSRPAETEPVTEPATE